MKKTGTSPSTELCFRATRSAGEVSALLMLPTNARWVYVFAHGAGAGMRHPFMEAAARQLADRGVGTLRYQFPYMEHGGKRPDPKPILFETVRSAVATAAEVAGGSPLLAGGKSMGGRMTSMAAAEKPLPGVQGLVFFGFPLHPAGQPSTERADHLGNVTLPMLFLQGTRDTLADLRLLHPICEKLGALSTLYLVDGADHSFHVLKSSGTSDGEVLGRLAQTVEVWAQNITR